MLAVLFWVLMLLALVLGVLWRDPSNGVGRVWARDWAGGLVIWLLLAMLGARVFGWPS